jgi:carboxyl-terminal processing protease
MLASLLVLTKLSYQQAAVAPAAPQTSVSSALTGTHKHEDYVTAWSSIESRIRSGFYARKGRKGEMEKLLTTTKPLVEAATNDAEFKQRIETMIAAFGDSHFDFLTKSDQGYYMFDSLVRGNKAEELPFIGAWFKPVEGGYQVTMVLENSEAAKVGLLPGDLVTKANDRPFEPVASFADRVDHLVTLQFRRGPNEKSCVVTPKMANALSAFLEASRSTIKVIPVGKKKIGYVHLWTQANESFRDLLNNAVYGPLVNTDAMILDLRDGFGGRPEGFADPFFRPDVELQWDFGGSKQRQRFGYGKPLIVLINHGSRSAKEILSFILKKSHRAKLIGTTTAGNVLGTSPSRVNSWSYLELPMVDVKADGVRLEKNGVRPDIEVDPERSPDGTDLVLQRALQELTR